MIGKVAVRSQPMKCVCCGAIRTAVTDKATCEDTGQDHAWHTITITPYQRGLARHALGLRKGQRVSYRNRYYASPGHKDVEAWLEMVSRGLAGHETPNFFYLTYAGALLALDKGEKLDAEDFPEAKVVNP